MSAFWNFIASVRDDVRHKVVEEGWYGRQVTDSAASPTEQGETPEGAHHPLYEQVWGKAATHAEVYGQGPAPAGPTSDPDPAPSPADPVPQAPAGHAPEL